MEKISLTENGIPNLVISLQSNQADLEGIVVQVLSSTHQVTNNKKMYKCCINDTKYKLNVVFIHNQDQDIETNDVIKIESIYVKQGNTTSIIIIKKYLILAKQMQPLAKGTFESYSVDASSNQANESLNNHNQINSNYNNYNDNNNSSSNNADRYANQTYNSNNNSNYNQQNYFSSNNNNLAAYPKRSADSSYLPLSAVSSFTKDILIKVRITKKFEKRTFGSGPKQGMVFSFNIIDEEGTEFPCCGFNKACENFYDIITEGKVYEISGGYVKINDKKYTTIKSEYKYFLDDKANVTEVDDDESIQHVQFNFKKLIELAELPQYTFIDVLGYVLKLNDVTQIKTKKGDDREMRKLQLADESGYKIEATIWGKLCQMPLNEGSVYAFKNLKLSEYNRLKNLTIGDDSTILEQDNKEAVDLQLQCSQLDKEKFKDVPNSLGEENNTTAGYVPQNLKFIKELLDMLDNVEDDNTKLKSFRVKAIVTGLQLNQNKFYYEGCPGCKRKLQANDRGEFACNTCLKNYEKLTLYYTLNIRIKDISGEIYVDILGHIGQKIFGKTAEELKQLIDGQKDDELKKMISDNDYSQYYFIIAPRINTYNEIRRKKFSVLKIDNVESVTESNRIIQELSKFY